MLKPFALTLGIGPENKPVTLRGREAMAHKHVIGVTGSGKSKLLENLFLQSLNQDVGCCLIDPHGDLCADILTALVGLGFYRDPRAYQRLLYIDFAHPGRYLPMNILAPQPPFDAHARARQLLEAWKRAWNSLAGGAAPLLEQVVLTSAVTLSANGFPLTAFDRLLMDAEFRARLLERVDDAQIRAFFATRYAAWGRRTALMTESAARRSFLFTHNPTLLYTLGQHENRLDWRALMDRRTSVLCDLGGLDEDSQHLLGCLLTVGVETAALSRADSPEEARTPYHLIIDEFPMFATASESSFERMLTLTRKYSLAMTLAHQVWGQAGRKLQSALQNSMHIAFRLGSEDAAWAAGALFRPDPYRIKHIVSDPWQAPRSHPVFLSASEQRLLAERELQDLPPQEAVVGLAEGPVRFRAVAIPSFPAVADEVAAARERYAELLLTPRARIDAQIANDLYGNSFTAGGAVSSAWSAHPPRITEVKHAGDDSPTPTPRHSLGQTPGLPEPSDNPSRRQRIVPFRDDGDDSANAGEENAGDDEASNDMRNHGQA